MALTSCDLPHPLGMNGGCSDYGDEVYTDQQKLDMLYEEILSMIQNKSCTTDSGSCKVIGVGAKACGGPTGFLIYHAGNIDEGLLIEKVKEYNQKQGDYNIQHGVVSDCSVLTEPQIGCVDGKCDEIKL